jgi:hydrogenase/urease accessory protein HupE
MTRSRATFAGAVCLVALAVAVAAPSPAAAHQSSFTYGRLAVDGDQVRYRLELKSTDLYEALGLDRDRDASAVEIRAGTDQLYGYVEERVSLELPGPCRGAREPVAITGGRDRFAALAWSYHCDRPVAELALDYRLFFDLDPRHIGLLHVDGETVQLQADAERFEWRIGGAIESRLGFVASGIDHIVFGLDHILFLVSLLIMVVITRSERGGWKLRPMREGFVYTAAIVTSFTVAHSVTLIAAALGWIDLPGRLVESVIAASIIYIAVENAVRPDPPRRYLLTFAFGLIHGLGFAAMLRPLLPPSDLVAPLLLFNVGVELGQLAVVLALLPLLYGLARLIGPPRYRRWILGGGAIVLGAMGTIWLIQRALDL